MVAEEEALADRDMVRVGQGPASVLAAEAWAEAAAERGPARVRGEERVLEPAEGCGSPAQVEEPAREVRAREDREREAAPDLAGAVAPAEVARGSVAVGAEDLVAGVVRVVGPEVAEERELEEAAERRVQENG